MLNQILKQNIQFLKKFEVSFDERFLFDFWDNA